MYAILVRKAFQILGHINVQNASLNHNNYFDTQQPRHSDSAASNGELSITTTTTGRGRYLSLVPKVTTDDNDIVLEMTQPPPPADATNSMSTIQDVNISAPPVVGRQLSTRSTNPPQQFQRLNSTTSLAMKAPYAKTIRTFALVTTCTVLCSLPFVVALPLEYWARNHWRTPELVRVRVFTLVAILLVIAHSSVNPIIYALRIGGFKQAFYALLRRRTSITSYTY